MLKDCTVFKVVLNLGKVLGVHIHNKFLCLLRAVIPTGASVAGPGCRIGCSVQVGLLEGGHPGVEKGKDSTAGTVQVTDGAAGKIQTV